MWVWCLMRLCLTRGWMCYIWFKTCDLLQLASAKTWEAGPCFKFGHRKHIGCFCAVESLELLTKLQAFELLCSLIFLLIGLLLKQPGLFVMKFKWRSFLAPGPGLGCFFPFPSFPWGGVNRLEIKGKEWMGKDRMINTWDGEIHR